MGDSKESVEHGTGQDAPGRSSADSQVDAEAVAHRPVDDPALAAEAVEPGNDDPEGSKRFPGAQLVDDAGDDH